MEMASRNRDETTENLWEFYKFYIKKYNYDPIDQELREAVAKNNRNIINTLKFKCGNMELYNIDVIKKSPWQEYMRVNFYAGDYKYRWGDNEVIGLFALTHFKKPFYDFKFKEGCLLSFIAK